MYKAAKWIASLLLVILCSGNIACASPIKTFRQKEPPLMQAAGPSDNLAIAINQIHLQLEQAAIIRLIPLSSRRTSEMHSIQLAPPLPAD